MGGESRFVSGALKDCRVGVGWEGSRFWVRSEVSLSNGYKLPEKLTDVAVASAFRFTPKSSSISSLCRPLLSKKAIFLSVVASRTSSSSRNLLAWSTIVCREDDSVDSELACAGGFRSLFGGLGCHEGTPDFF